MNITLEPVNFNASAELQEHVKSMFAELEHYYDKIVNIDIFLKSLTETDTGEKEIEVKVHLPGKEVFMDHKAESFVSAAQQAYDKLKRHLAELKERDKDHRQPRVEKP